MHDHNHITSLLKRHRLWLDKRLGQHFLIDLDALGQIRDASCAGPDSDVVEIGAGLGNLTYALASTGAHVTAIEIDRRFEPVHAEVFANRAELTGGVEFLYSDALEFDFAAAAKRATDAGRRFLVAGNIPYQITSPLIMRVLESGAQFDAMTIMMQAEVAERLAAAPGTKRNGSISIKVQYYCDLETICDVPGDAFLPPPDVNSLVLRFKLRKQELDEEGREKLFRIVDAAFAQRRKMLPNSMNATMPEMEKSRVEEALKKINIPITTRAEQLGLPEFLQLYHALCD